MLTIDRVLVQDSGQYVCDALNEFGGQRNEVTVKVLAVPKIVISPNQLSLVEGRRETLQCKVENKENDEKCLISWMINGKVDESVRTSAGENILEL